MSNKELIKDPAPKGKYQFEIEWPLGGRSVAHGNITGEQFKQVWAILFPEPEKPISGIEMQYFQDDEGKIPATKAGDPIGLVVNRLPPFIKDEVPIRTNLLGNGPELCGAAWSKPAHDVASVPDGAESFDTPAEFLAYKILVKRSEVLGRPLTWRESIELIAITTNMPDADKAKLLALDDAAPSATAAQGWIPVSERLPEGTVTHWMNLPAAPKGGE